MRRAAALAVLFLGLLTGSLGCELFAGGKACPAQTTCQGGTCM